MPKDKVSFLEQWLPLQLRTHMHASAAHSIKRKQQWFSLTPHMWYSFFRSSQKIQPAIPGHTISM